MKPLRQNLSIISLLLPVILWSLRNVNADCTTLKVSGPRLNGIINSRTNVIEIGISVTITSAFKPPIVIGLDPPLEQGIDFEINYMIAENSLPYHHNPRRNTNTSVISLTLLQGKQWIKDRSTRKQLFVNYAYYCSQAKELSSFRTHESIHVHIASFKFHENLCPTVPKLPGLWQSTSQMMNNLLHDCANIRVIKLKKLMHRKEQFSSLQFLSPNSQMTVIDATDYKNLTQIASEVDTFITPYSVLEIVWEPYDDQEPKYIVLMPHPRGMPGHLFAMLDNVQFRHPLVSTLKGLDAKTQCTDNKQDLSTCTIGCPGTWFHLITGAGMGAATGMVTGDFTRALFWNEPLQVAPLTLGEPKLGGPKWEGHQGWMYTYGGCPSNFLDCYYLPHSPCPDVKVDVGIMLKHNKSRCKGFFWDQRETYDKLGEKNAQIWWNNVFFSEPNTPWKSVGMSWELPATQAFGTYAWRPNYNSRLEIHRRTDAFNMKANCAAMHVRRSDSILEARWYIRVEQYVRHSKRLLDAMNIKTIFLLTDGQDAIDEANNCARDYPDVCQDIKFHFIKKKRWYAYEGGWENTYPSGNPQLELYTMMQELALVQKCQVFVSGENSNFGHQLYRHMCCAFPFRERGRPPQRCICPPRIMVNTIGLSTKGFQCEDGNILMCPNSTESNKAQFLKAGNLSKATQSVSYLNNDGVIHVNTPIDPNDAKIGEFIQNSIRIACEKYDRGPPRGTFCK